VKDEQGNPVMIPGSLKSVKAIGWYIREYGVAQISMNLTNISITPVHVAFDEVSERARDRGMRVTGSELVGLVPLNAMLEAGRYYLRKQKRSLGVSDAELIKIAVKSMGLDELGPFKPEEKIIEYQLRDQSERLVDMSLEAFMEETASESPAPGGGSISAYMGALGVALGSMVANLSAHKRGWDERWEEFSQYAEEGKALQQKLLHLVDEDTRAFNRIMEAFSLPKNSEEDQARRKTAIREATLEAIRVPYQVMETAHRGFRLAGAMTREGNPNSVSDAGVGALAMLACVEGAMLNVKINAAGMEHEEEVSEILVKGKEILQTSRLEKEKILLEVEDKIGG
jgi:glutamate formiminotransferase/formiminotetrahydrofolate cyclodeaminase